MACVFAKALLARHAQCSLAQRQQQAERTLLKLRFARGAHQLRLAGRADA
jgi:hypothetical protein